MKKYFKWIKKAETTTFDICFVLGTGWNALHESLPVLAWIKEYYSNVKILSVIGENNAKEQSILNKTYYDMLLNYSDAMIMQDWMQTSFYPLRRLHLSLHKKVYKKYMPIQMDKLLYNIVIKNVIYGDSELPVFKYILKKYPKQDGTQYFNTGEISFESMAPFSDDLGTNFANAVSVYFAKDEQYAKMLREKLKNIKIVMSGSPKLDPWWIDKHKKLFTSNHKKLRRDKKIIAIALPKLDDGGIRLTAYEEEQLLSFLNANRNYDYIIAFHPRDDRRHRQKFMENLDFEYEIWDGDLMTLSETADALIYVGLSTGQADCVVAEKPLILFYDDLKKKDCTYCFSNGQYGDFFHVHDVVPHARTAEALAEKVYGCFNSGMWATYKYRYMKYVPRLPSCKIISEYILDNKP